MRTSLDVPPRTSDPMVPGMGLLMVSKDLRADERSDEERPTPGLPSKPPKAGRLRRVVRSRWLAWSLALVLVGSAGAAAAVGIADARSDTDRLAAELAALRTARAEDSAYITAAEGRNAGLRQRIAKLQEQIAELEASRVRTIVETETVTVTETVTEYVPNGEGVTVEITGFEGLLEVYDVHLTHSYGYSDLIGIAENTSGETISYAQLSCSFLDQDGKLLATSIDNKQDWRAGQSWGFVCSADVDAIGGILRVDEMS